MELRPINLREQEFIHAKEVHFSAHEAPVGTLGEKIPNVISTRGYSLSTPDTQNSD